MRKYLPTMLLIFAAQLLQAQQLFNPFVSRFTYQYLNLSKDTVSSLRCIEVGKTDGDSIVTFNNVFKYRSQENIFGKKLIYKSNGDYLFVINNIDTLRLKTLASVGEEWLLCKSPRTMAKNIGNFLETFLGISDSVLTIKTDKGFEIKISKNYGMVKTIDMGKYVTNKFIKPLYIDAIPEVRLGTFANDPLVLFDYKIGELFVWKEVYFNPWLLLTRTSYARYKLKDKIMSLNLDTVTYKFVADCNINSIKYTNTYDNIYSEKNDRKFGEIVEKQYYRISKNAKDKEEKYSLLSNEYSSYGLNEVILFDSILKRYTLKIARLYVGGVHNTDIYKTGLGLTFSDNCTSISHNGQCEITNSSELLCYIKDKEAYKDCDIYDKLLSNDEAFAPKYPVMDIFPNPTASVINILPHGDDNWQKIQVINSLGALVLEKKFSYVIDLESISDGIYTIIVYTKKGGYFMKKVVKMNVEN